MAPAAPVIPRGIRTTLLDGRAAPTVTFSHAELSAMRLDGALLGYGDAYIPVDVPDSPRMRLDSVSALDDRRLIAERLTAAWVHGALPGRPTVATVAFDAGDKIRPVRSPGLVIREVILLPGDLETLGPYRLTSARRTLLDLARVGPDVDDAVLSALADLSGTTLEIAAQAFCGRNRLPDKRRAIERIQRALA